MMRWRRLLPAALVGFAMQATHAQTACPWLTQGTAAAALGGTPITAATATSLQQGSCSFTLDNNVLQSSLEITVAPAQLLPHLTCPSGSPPLTSIGNAAVLCSLAVTPPSDKQLIVSRVRTVSFTVLLTATPRGSAPLSKDRQRDALIMVAEQVAGNLY